MVYMDENVKEWVNDSLKTLWSLRNNTWGCSPTSTLSLSYSLSRTQSFWLLSRRKITKEGKGVEKKSSGGGGEEGGWQKDTERQEGRKEKESHLLEQFWAHNQSTVHSSCLVLKCYVSIFFPYPKHTSTAKPTGCCSTLCGILHLCHVSSPSPSSTVTQKTLAPSIIPLPLALTLKVSRPLLRGSHRLCVAHWQGQPCWDWQAGRGRRAQGCWTDCQWKEA